MKNILIGLMVLGSFSTLATTDFEEALSLDSNFLQESKNYETKHVNDDGSITIVGPKFSSPDGRGSLNLSVENEGNLYGICKLFGEGDYVRNSVRYIGGSGSLVRISRSAKFDRFEAASEKNAVNTIICQPSNKTDIGPSANAEKFLSNDDGSITILNPKFSNADGSGNLRLSVSDDSNLEGICKLFGFKKYVQHSSRYVDGRGTLVRISRKGKFEKFDSSKDRNALSSLMCEK